MSDSLEERRAKRFRFLHALYELTGGNVHEHPSMWDIATSLGLSKKDAELVVQYLTGENLIEFAAMGGYIAITHYGVLEVERALSEPQQATEYFPPVINVLNIGTVSGSNIQQAGSHSSLTASVGVPDAGALREIVGLLQQAVADLGEAFERRQELVAMTATIEAQAKMPTPNSTIVREALSTIRNVLEGTTGSLVAAELLRRFGQYFQ